MQYTSILKRAVPFVLSATVGFVIASFFVPISAPSLGSKNQSWGKRHECRKLKREFRQLRDENIRLRLEVEDARRELSEIAETTVRGSGRPNGDGERFYSTNPPPPPPPPIHTKRLRVVEAK